MLYVPLLLSSIFIHQKLSSVYLKLCIVVGTLMHVSKKFEAKECTYQVELLASLLVEEWPGNKPHSAKVYITGVAVYIYLPLLWG